MASRLTGAIVALLAAVLLVSAVFSRGWWDGHPIVSGEVRHVQDMHVGPLGGDFCNTGGDGACHAMPLVGGFKATGYLVAIVVGMLAAAAAVLAVLALMQSERRRSIGKLMFGGVGAGVIVTLALYIQGPALNSPQQVIIPLGHGMLFFWVGAAFAIAAGVLARRTTQPLVLKSGPSWIPQGAPVTAASPGGPLAGFAGPLGAAGFGGGGHIPDPYAPFGAPPAPHVRPPSAQLAVPPSPQHPFGSPSAPVAMAYSANPFAAPGDPPAPSFAPPPPPLGAVTRDRPRTLPPPPGRAKSSSLPAPPTPNPDASRPRTAMGAAGPAPAPASIMAPPRPRSASIAPPLSVMAPPRQASSTRPPPSIMAPPRLAGSTIPPPRMPGSTVPPPVAPVRRPGSTLPPLAGLAPNAAPAGGLPRVAPGPSKAPPLRAQVPFPDPGLRAPTTQDAWADGHTELSAAALDVGDHTSPSNPFAPSSTESSGERASHTEVVATIPEQDGSTDETTPAPESRSPSARRSASYPSHLPTGPTATDKVPTLAGDPMLPPIADARVSAELSAAQPPLSTAPDSLPPPTAQQAIVSGPSPACPQCEAPMAWVEAHLRFYCKSCKMYF